MSERSELPDDAELRRLFDDARAAWRPIEVPFAVFVARMQDGGRSAGWPTVSAHARDVYLACACSASDATALARFEQHYLQSARAAIARVDSSADFIAEVQQVVRERLLVGREAKIKEYRGSGALAGWARTAAVRAALNMRRSEKLQARLAQPRAAEEEPLLDPQLAIVKRRYEVDIGGALQRALAGLDCDDRLLLRYHYVDRLTLAKIAVLQKTSVSTIFRRLSAVAEAVRVSVKQDLGERLRLSTESLDSLLRIVRDDIDLRLSQLLGRDATDERA
jgi:RNA polymerase sigma-70 factor (ECF subfamily)